MQDVMRNRTQRGIPTGTPSVSDVGNCLGSEPVYESLTLIRSPYIRELSIAGAERPSLEAFLVSGKYALQRRFSLPAARILHNALRRFSVGGTLQVFVCLFIDFLGRTDF